MKPSVNHDCCYIEKSETGRNILEYMQGEKSIKNQFAMYSDAEPLLEKINTC